MLRTSFIKKAELVSTPRIMFGMDVAWSQVPLELAAVLPAFVDQEILLVINLPSYPALHDTTTPNRNTSQEVMPHCLLANWCLD